MPDATGRVTGRFTLRLILATCLDKLIVQAYLLQWVKNEPVGQRRVSAITARERLADGCIHVIGVAASLVALAALLIVGVMSQTTLWVVSLAIYGVGLVLMFSFSAGYNLCASARS